MKTAYMKAKVEEPENNSKVKNIRASMAVRMVTSLELTQ